MRKWPRSQSTIKAAFLLAASALCAAQTKPPAHEVAIAAAANLTEVFQAIGPQFEAATGIHPIFSFASTATLALQITHGAPFDLFAAADTEHPEQLDRAGLLAPGSRAIYATGILALWIPPTSHARVGQLRDLVSPTVKVIAVAKPELAPYGAAAIETLQHLGVWTQLQPRIVYAENISMAKQYGTSGNADAVFTAYSLVRTQKGKAILVDENLHHPITQALGIVAASKHPDAARAFRDFLLSGKGRDILASSGYRTTARR